MDSKPDGKSGGRAARHPHRPASGPQTPRERPHPAERPAAGPSGPLGLRFSLAVDAQSCQRRGRASPPTPTGPGGVGCSAAVTLTLRPWSPAAGGVRPSERLRETLTQGVG